MGKTPALAVEQYLSELPAERQQALSAVRNVILKNLPSGYEETMLFGMISYVIPLATYPVTYNKQPLTYVSLTSQKHHMAIYLMNIYASPETEQWFDREYAASGKRLNRGKACVRFKKLDDLPLELIGEAVAKTSLAEYIQLYEASRQKGR